MTDSSSMISSPPASAHLVPVIEVNGAAVTLGGRTIWQEVALSVQPGAHYVTRNRTHESDFSPFSFVCVSGNRNILIFIIGWVRFLVKSAFLALGSLLAWREGFPARLTC